MIKKQNKEDFMLNKMNGLIGNGNRGGNQQ